MKQPPASPLWVSLCCVVLLVAALAAAGCTGAGTPAASQDTATAGAQETIKISGSTTVLPIVQKAAEAYMATHPNADIQVSGGGSGVGIQQIGEKTVDIGMSSRELKSTESASYPDLVKHVVAKDGIAIIVNQKNQIQNIKVDDVRKIYAGEIASWTGVSGNVPGTGQQIVVVGRDSASGTREFFDKDAAGVMKGASVTKAMIEKNSNGALSQTIAQTPQAIGYVSIGYITGDVKAVPVITGASTEAITPGAETVRNGNYPLQRELFVFTNGQPAGLAKDFIDFIRSAEGQKIVEEEGFVSTA